MTQLQYEIKNLNNTLNDIKIALDEQNKKIDDINRTNKTTRRTPFTKGKMDQIINWIRRKEPRSTTSTPAGL